MYFSKDKIVQKTIREGNVAESSLHISYGVDKNYMFGVGVSITSILINNTDIHTTFHIFTDYLDKDYHEKICELAKQYDTCIYIYLVNGEDLKKLPRTHNWSHAMYFRFITFDYLSDQLKQLLYLDGDVICKGSLKPLIDFEFGDSYAAVVKDIDTLQKKEQWLGVEALRGNYFNSGVILTNLIAWKDNDLTQKAMDVFSDEKMKKRLVFFDQDVLNLLFLGHVIFLGKEYNSMYCVKDELKVNNSEYYKEVITDETVLIHYTGVTKPWHEWAVYESVKYFKYAYQASPWCHVPLIKATTTKLFKKKSKHERYQKKHIRSIISHVQYIISKLKSKF